MMRLNLFLIRAHNQTDTLIPYQAGMSTQSLQNIASDTIIKLASNENPLGMSPKAKVAMLKDINDTYLYPEKMGNTLHALAKHLNVSAKQCILGNGSENIIAMLIQIFNRPENHFLIPQYAFSAYRINAKAHNASIKIIPTPNYQVNVKDILSLVNPNTALVFIDNPNNPTGHYLTHNEILSLLKKLPASTLLVLDEAYYEFAKNTNDYPNALALQKDYPNLVIIRTFSKVYGLAGLRVGYGIAHTDIIELLNRVRFPFNVSSLALSAAQAALDDNKFMEQSIANNTASILAFQACFKQLGIDAYPALGNFITIDLKQNASDFFQFMLEQGIILRPLNAYELPNHIRISMGRQEQNALAIQYINHYFGKKTL